MNYDQYIVNSADLPWQGYTSRAQVETEIKNGTLAIPPEVILDTQSWITQVVRDRRKVIRDEYNHRYGVKRNDFKLAIEAESGVTTWPRSGVNELHERAGNVAGDLYSPNTADWYEEYADEFESLVNLVKLCTK